MQTIRQISKLKRANKQTPANVQTSSPKDPGCNAGYCHCEAQPGKGQKAAVAKAIPKSAAGMAQAAQKQSTSGWVKTQPAQTDCTWEPNLHACQSSCHEGIVILTLYQYHQLRRLPCSSIPSSASTCLED